MDTDARISALKERHAALEEKLNEEANRPMPDDAAIHAIKREKLHLKDEIQRLSAG